MPGTPSPVGTAAGDGQPRGEYGLFLSHATPDNAWVLTMAEWLQALGLRVFVDTLAIGPGDNWVIRRVLSAELRSRRSPGPHGQAERSGGSVRNRTGQSRRRLGRACQQTLEQLPETRPQSGGDRSGACRFPSAAMRRSVSR